jgi:TonB family protein
MQMKIRTVVIAVGGVAAIALAAAAQELSRASIATFTSESVLRRAVVKSLRPACPAGNVVGTAAGVAVVKVDLEPSGRVMHVQVLESPSPAVSDSVSTAVSQWIFEPQAPVGGRPQSVSGKLTFYFARGVGGCEVLYPAEAHYVGRWAKLLDKTPR